MLIKELLALNEAMLAKEKKGLADEAAKLMKVSPSEILDITNMWDAIDWDSKALDTAEVGDEKLILRGKLGADEVRVVHVIRTEKHPNLLFSTKQVLMTFMNSQRFEDDMLHHTTDGDKSYAKSVLDKYRKHGLAPAFVIKRLKDLLAQAEDETTRRAIQQRIDSYA